MTIEFACTHCSAILRVSQDLAGKSARCPSCQSVVPVPGNEPSFQPSRPTGEAALNPYRPTTAEPLSDATPGQAPAVPFNVIFHHATSVWQQHLGLLMGATVITVGVSIGFGVATSGLENAGLQNNNGNLIAASNILSIISSLTDLFLGIGYARICLALSRRQTATLGLLVTGGDKFFPILGSTILMFFASAIALLLLIVPLLLLWMFFWPYYYLIVDRQSGALESFSRAVELTKRNAGTSFLLIFSSIGIMLLGFLMLCIGALFAAPLIGVMWATAYLMMRGEIPIHRLNP